MHETVPSRKTYLHPKENIIAEIYAVNMSTHLLCSLDVGDTGLHRPLDLRQEKP